MAFVDFARRMRMAVRQAMLTINDGARRPRT